MKDGVGGGELGQGMGGGSFSDWLNCLRDQQPEILFCVQKQFLSSESSCFVSSIKQCLVCGQ